MHLSRRAFLTGCLAVGAARGSGQAQALPWADVGRGLRARFADLRRHFVFEYYPWYANAPFRHWQQWGRQPPVDLAAASVPLLGAYDSRSIEVVTQHARWIAESGVGVINLSWWRPDSFSDRAVHTVMDVMHDHDIKVTFHLEPYGPDRVDRLSADIRYLLAEYGDKRGWDAFFLHDRADGTRGPVFKLFATTWPAETTDCHGETVPTALHAPPPRWRRAIDHVRADLDGAFDHVTLLSDSVDVEAVKTSGFDGVATYNPLLSTENGLGVALAATRSGLLFSFGTNPGFDEIDRRKLPPGSCYVPRPFFPDTSDIDWSRSGDRLRAQELATTRLRETLEVSVALQTHPWLGNVERGFFLVYLTSFNEWHEGTQFEPMKDRSMLTPAERSLGYHNPDNGRYRLDVLTEMLGRL